MVVHLWLLCGNAGCISCACVLVPVLYGFVYHHLVLCPPAMIDGHAGGGYLGGGHLGGEGGAG